MSKVETPSRWCAGIVVAPKKSENVRFCVDLNPLNEAVLREPHPIPSVNNQLALLSGAVHFSKLDAYSGFWKSLLEKTL